MPLSDRLNHSRWLSLLLLGLYCTFLFFYGLEDSELYRNETLPAILAQGDMLHTGNWIVPTLYGQPLFTKPPGIYVAIALCSLPFGEVTKWTARLPSALAATVTVILTYWFFARQLDRRAGLLAGLLLPMSAFWLERSTSAEIDMVQVAWVTAAILFFLRALSPSPPTIFKGVVASVPSPLYPGERGRGEGEQHPSRNRPVLAHATAPSPPTPLPRVQGRGEKPVPRESDECGPWFESGRDAENGPSSFGWLLAALLCVAGGTLTKWTAPAFFYCTAIPFLWWRGRLRLLCGWQHLLSALIAGGLVLAWIGAAVAQTSWDLFYETVSREALNHLSPGHGHKGYPWVESLFHPAKVLATMLPWSAVGLLALRPSFQRNWDERGRFLLQALHCWAWPSLLFWSLASEHSVRHSAPLFPALSGLAAMVCVAWSRGLLAWRLPRLRPTHVLAGALAVWMIVKVLYIQVVIPQRVAQRHTRDKATLLASLVPLDKILYLFKVKDEGIMFYFGRPVLRLHDKDTLPSSGRPVFCILTEEEWRLWSGSRSAEMVERMQDAQGDDMILVCVR